jgi:hypothetical protein
VKKFQKAATKSANKKAYKKMSRDEHNNRYSICKKQLEYRLLGYIRAYKTLPSRSTKGEGGKICKALFRRFGSLSKAFSFYGLPTLKRYGSTFELLAPNGKVLFANYNKNYNRDMVYAWMLENTTVLK